LLFTATTQPQDEERKEINVHRLATTIHHYARIAQLEWKKNDRIVDK